MSLCEPWGCGVPSGPRSPAHHAVTAHVTSLLGLTHPPTGCPLAAIYRSAPPIVHRAVAGLGGMEDGLDGTDAFPGGVTAVDVAALSVLRRARAARMRSDDAIRAKEQKQKETADLAAGKGKR